ncbi:hypothetical protein J5N97_012662 [Dioscorea zingiberensis]|uniref:Uncharacterized protein n=1 Tax=Dioscorea zingiberensis TaxID=325984 RepID=A0A9D5CPD4_9LILI|nr:hypothetical protein J5N97_012662 [Dioscorea zingiberensis]
MMLLFDVVYYPRTGLPNFIVEVAMVDKGLMMEWTLGRTVKTKDEIDDGRCGRGRVPIESVMKAMRTGGDGGAIRGGVLSEGGFAKLHRGSGNGRLGADDRLDSGNDGEDER